MIRSRNLALAATSLIALAGIAAAQNSAAARQDRASRQAVGRAGHARAREIDGTVFHAQVLLERRRLLDRR